jgi:hypothetical protein
MGEERKVYRFFLWESPKERDHWDNQGIDGRMRSEWIIGTEIDWGVQSGSSWLRIGAVVGCCEYGYEPVGSGATELLSYVEDIYTSINISYCSILLCVYLKESCFNQNLPCCCSEVY